MLNNYLIVFLSLPRKETDIRIHTIEYPTNQLKNELHEERLMKKVETKGTTLAYALSADGTHPLIVQQGTSYYVATPNLFDWMSHYVGEMLFSYFEQKPVTNKTSAYLRLEDVHPAVDVKQLKEIAELLKEKKLPYMITVIPVYKDPRHRKNSTFKG